MPIPSILSLPVGQWLHSSLSWLSPWHPFRLQFLNLILRPLQLLSHGDHSVQDVQSPDQKKLIYVLQKRQYHVISLALTPIMVMQQLQRVIINLDAHHKGRCYILGTLQQDLGSFLGYRSYFWFAFHHCKVCHILTIYSTVPTCLNKIYSYNNFDFMFLGYDMLLVM